ncbi:MAG: hypothetical protein KGZ39_05655 [Simkania sp.]|nr:hypothetical protein [Simkania sp.]
MENKWNNFKQGEFLTANWVNSVNEKLQRTNIIAGHGIKVVDDSSGVHIMAEPTTVDPPARDSFNLFGLAAFHGSDTPTSKWLAIQNAWNTPNLYNESYIGGADAASASFQMEEDLAGSYDIPHVYYGPRGIKVLNDMDVFLTTRSNITHSVSDGGGTYPATIRRYFTNLFIGRKDDTDTLRWYSPWWGSSIFWDYPQQYLYDFTGSGFSLVKTYKFHEQTYFTDCNAGNIRLKKNDLLRWVVSRDFYGISDFSLAHFGGIDYWFVWMSCSPTNLSKQPVGLGDWATIGLQGVGYETGITDISPY